ncbi:transcription cofactor vestigial-like protein 1 isoform X2 [Syngnathus acus]|uniref:transcription cofactor vestigial-like protein 1 isoform X2 n=1 Tax=Syngnathus acus TaxID=161584 RepID=UPI001885EFBA|nr:transcription cofactor vestigial-like protein 1 isoform X2 [Syngnathus acus]
MHKDSHTPFHKLAFPIPLVNGKGSYEIFPDILAAAHEGNTHQLCSQRKRRTWYLPLVSADRPMEEGMDSPVAVKVEGHSRSVILRYFRGDIGSMVDAHFSRALSKDAKDNMPAAKAKRMRKNIKSESNTCHTNLAEPLPVAGRHLALGPADDHAGSWHPFIGRTRETSGLPSAAYSVEDLSLTGQQYASSLLNLLHSDRSEMGPGVASGSKAEHLANWMVPQGFRDSVEPAGGFEPGKPSYAIQHVPSGFLGGYQTFQSGHN